MNRPSLFELAVNVPAWLASDVDTPYTERLRRDRGAHAAATVSDQAVPDVERLQRWWQARAPHPPLPGARMAGLRRLAGWLLVGLGVLTGSSAALLLFSYDGTEPVNLAQVLGVFVVLQLLLALLSVLLLPLRIPGWREVQDLVADLTPGGLATTVLRRVLGRSGDTGDLPLGWHQARVPAAAMFARWQALCLSQLTGLAFNLTALLTAAAMITFSDLAFAWSTTLAVDPDRVQTVTAALALPFAWLLPDVLPDLALIEASQFNRADGIDAMPAAITGRWWPFVLACMFTWGVLPRIVLLAAATWQLRRATENLLLEDPRVTALLDRMNTPLVEQRPRGDEPGPPQNPAVTPTPEPADAPGAATVVIWSAAASPGELDRHLRPLGLRPGGIHRAGGDASIEQDTHTIEMIAAAAPRRVLIVTRSWEPPLLEMLDFAADLRAAAPDASVTFVPLPANGEPLQAAHVATWKRAVSGLADPRVYVEGAIPA